MPLATLMTRDRWIELFRIVGVLLVILLFVRELVPLAVLLVAVAVGLYPLLKTGLLDLVRERKIGTEIFVSIATTIAMIGGEYVAGAILMVIILIAEVKRDEGSPHRDAPRRWRLSGSEGDQVTRTSS